MAKDKNARRFFLDLSEDGEVIITAPKRTDFDEQRFHDRLRLEGNSVPPPGFHGTLEFGGRVFVVTVQSVAQTDAAPGAETFTKDNRDGSFPHGER